MRLFNWFACTIIGHQPRYFQTQVMKNGQWRRQNHATCTRCGSSDSQRIHTPGLLDFPAWFGLGADAVRSSLIAGHRRRRRALRRLFRKRTG